MEKLRTELVIKYLTKYRDILTIIDAKTSKRELNELDSLIKYLEEYGNSDQSIKESKTKKNEKVPFEEIIKLWKDKKLDNVKGLKLNYKNFTCEADVIHYFEGYKREEMFKLITLIDLKLLYFILTGDEKERKKNKNEIFDLILSYIKAQKQGEAFSKWL
jgi:hypothetical protein